MFKVFKNYLITLPDDSSLFYILFIIFFYGLVAALPTIILNYIFISRIESRTAKLKKSAELRIEHQFQILEKINKDIVNLVNNLLFDLTSASDNVTSIVTYLSEKKFFLESKQEKLIIKILDESKEYISKPDQIHLLNIESFQSDLRKTVS